MMVILLKVRLVMKMMTVMCKGMAVAMMMKIRMIAMMRRRRRIRRKMLIINVMFSSED